MNEFLKNLLNSTFFLTKALDFFEGFFKPNTDYKIIACQASEEVANKYTNVFVEETETGKRVYSTSKSLLKIIQNPDNVLEVINKRNIWVYQAYPWTNDLLSSGKNVFAIDYYLYLKLQNKLNQRRILLEYSSDSKAECQLLNENLIKSSSVFKTNIFPKTKLNYKSLQKIYNTSFVVSASNSNGGEGVYKISNELEYSDALAEINGLIIRTEQYIENSIPVNQIAFISYHGDIIKYKPSIQIIKGIHKKNKMEYAGCDFNSEHYINDASKKFSILSKLTHEIGLILFNIGYKGTFGCDYLISNDIIHFIELNPRYQASTLIPNLHLNNNEILSPHILHMIGFINPPNEYVEAINKYSQKNIYLDFVLSGKPTGFLNIYEDAKDKMRKPAKNIIIEKGVRKGYILHNEPFIENPHYPTVTKIL